MAMAGGSGELEAEVIIVGAGIAGLATALALRRAGVGVGGGVLVLERHPELRATGAALTIFPSGWFAHKLMSRYDAYETFQVTNLENGATQVFRFAARKNSGDIKARPADRKALLEALADYRPPSPLGIATVHPRVNSDNRRLHRLFPVFAALCLTTVWEPSLLVYHRHGTTPYWSRPTHARCWQHRRVPSSPTHPRAWQARIGASSSSASTTSSSASTPTTASTASPTIHLAYSVLAKP